MTTKLNSEGFMYIGEDWPLLIKNVYETLAPASVLDVGCGPCRSMKYFNDLGAEVRGIDGSVVLLENPQVEEFKDRLVLLDLEASPCVMGQKFDLVWSYEVAEHIGNEDNYLITLTANAEKYIVMTAAPPGQGGTHHVNCQTREYWIAKLADRGFDYCPELVQKFNTGWETSGYMAISGMVFKRRVTNMSANGTDFVVHYLCYKDKRATYEALKSFRAVYPNVPIRLISDGGDDFGPIARHFNCDYIYMAERSGNGKSTYLETNAKVMLWLKHLKDTCLNYHEEWILILEDDVRTRGPIKHQPPAPLAGPCTMEYTAKLKAAIRKKHKGIKINGYSGCGGSVFHRETFLKCEMFDIDKCAKLDHRVAHHSDAILTLLFLYNGYENKQWLDQSEESCGRGRTDAAFDHQYKKWYGMAWDDKWLEAGVPQPALRGRGQPLRCHLLGLAHLPTRWEMTSCAYTWKILRLAKMLRSRGHEVVFYGSELSEVDCNKFEVVGPEATRAGVYGEFDKTGQKSFQFDSQDQVHQEFNNNTKIALRRNWEDHDLLLCTMGLAQKPIADTINGLVVESGIGYEGIFAKYKVFESYAWRHFLYGKHNTNDGHNYDAVIPNAYDASTFPLCRKKPEPYLLHVSRLIERKGIRMSIRVARELGVKLVVAGQGNIADFLSPEDTNVQYVGLVGGEQKMKLFSEATALIQPTVYIGPFEGVVAEAQLCGVPVLTTDWGVFAETVEQGETGFRCRTLREFMLGWDAIRNGLCDPEYIQDRAASLWDMSVVAEMYEHYFYNLLDLYGQGWFAK